MKMTPAERREIYLAYLRMKVDEEEWHGVSDAANDLRELEAAHPSVRWAGDAMKAHGIVR